MQQQMTCPKCLGPMRQYERSGVIVDQCQECRGIFLDRGELERLADAENAHHGRSAAPAHEQRGSHEHQRHDEHRDQYQRHDEHRDQYHHKKKHSFFEELFD